MIKILIAPKNMSDYLLKIFFEIKFIENLIESFVKETSNKISLKKFEWIFIQYVLDSNEFWNSPNFLKYTQSL